VFGLGRQVGYRSNSTYVSDGFEPWAEIAMAYEKISDWNITLDQLLDQIRIEVGKALDKYFDALQKANSSNPFAGTELGDKVKDCAERNIAISRDYMHKLNQAKDLLEIVPIHTELVQAHLDSFGQQIKSLGETYTKAATEILNKPL
jgi:hypothetical protein